MIKYGIIAFIGLIVFGAPRAEASLPTGHTPDSEYYIDYSDLGVVLRGSVLHMGPSTHAAPKKKNVKYTSSKLQVGNLLKTRHEGNRVLFHMFGEKEIAALQAIRDDLLRVPDELSLNYLSRDEQLAYFLNLHTSIVLAEIADRYPITDLQDLYDIEDPESFINQKRFELAGTQVSLLDIQRHVVQNWDEQNVIYGFYFGAVGTPNVRTEPYKADIVFDQLRENGRNYVNSMRGTQIWKPSQLKVASYYERMKSAFPNFDRDLEKHIRGLANHRLLPRLALGASIKPRISDWNIADLYNGRPFADPNGRYPSANRDANDVAFKMRVPEHVEQLLLHRELKAIRARRNPGSVEVEALPSSVKDEEKSSS